MMEIEAAVTRAKDHDYVIETVELADPRVDEVRVRIVATGLCHTDLSARAGFYPLEFPAVLGHEGAGVVDKVGSGVTQFSEGDHVVMTYDSCGICRKCRTGLPAFCDTLLPRNAFGHRLDGTSAYSQKGDRVSGHFFAQSSFATYSIATERNLVKVRKDAPLELLGPLGCGIQTGAGAIINALQARPGSTVIVFGAGSVGLAAVMAAKLSGCAKIVTVDRLEMRLSLARELGATHVIDGSRENLVDELLAIEPYGFDYALDFVGRQEILDTAIAALHNRGICLLGATAPIGTRLSFDFNAVQFGKQIRGVVEGDGIPHIFIPQLIEHYMAGRFPLDRLVTIFPFDQINAAVAANHDGTAVKAIVKMPTN